MSYTCFDIMLALSRLLQPMVESVATGGSLTTLVDSKRFELDDHFNEGTIFFITGNEANKSAIITDYTLSTKTFQFAAPGGAGILATDQYAAAIKDFPRYVLMQKVNDALREMRIPEQDATLTTVAGQYAYTLPAGVYNVKIVETSEETTAPDAETQWIPNLSWDEFEGKLIFKGRYVPVTTGYYIRLTYMARPDLLDADADTISEHVNFDRLLWSSAVNCLRWRLVVMAGDEPERLRFLNEALVNAVSMMSKYPIPYTEPVKLVGPAW